MLTRWIRSLLFLFLCVCAAFAAPAPAASPTILIISPTSVTQGNPGFTITVTGTNFAPGDVITVDASPISTTYVNSSTLTGAVPARFLTAPSKMPIDVRDINQNASIQLFLTINPAPTISSDTPQNVDAGSPSFTLAILGTNFVPGCAVRVGGNPVSTSYISTNQLSAAVPASLLVNSGRLDVVVATSDGAVSNAGALIVAPVLTSLGNVQVNGNQVTIDATGVGFIPSDFLALTANGVQLNLPTTFLSSTKLRATFTPSALAIGGGSFNVFEPDGVDSRFLQYSLPFSIASFAPGGAVAGGPAFTLVISGGIFPPGTLVLWAGAAAPLATTVTSPNQLTATVPASLIASAGVFTVQAFHPNGNTVSAPFSVNSGLTISSFSPASATSGGPAFTLTVNGGGFLSGAVVQWNGTPLPTTYVSSTQLTATISASQIAAVGSAAIVVSHPGGALSNSVPFAIAAPATAAVITSLSPSAAIAGASNVVLTVNGAGFSANSSVYVNGLPLANSTFVNSTQLIVTVPAGMVATPGATSITVHSGSAVSGAAVFSVLSGPPVTGSAAIVNLGNASSPMAPGSLFSVYGSGLSTVSGAAIGTPLPNLLNGVSVTVNGLQAPLLFVSPSQINAQLPFEAPPGLATVVVNLGGVAGAPAIVQLAPIGPGVWSMPDGRHTLAINDADESLGTPVSPGTYVTIYVTGQGALAAPVPTGAAAPEGPLATPAATVQATVGGTQATNVVSAMAPDLVGVLQVNLQVPAVAAGDQPLVITIGGVPSNVTYLPIAGQ